VTTPSENTDTIFWRHVGRLPQHDIDPKDADGSLRAKWNPIVTKGKTGEFGLRANQAAMLEAASLIAKYPGCGMFAQSAVGSGKSLAILLFAMLYPDVKTTVLLLPPDLVTEMEGEIFKWREHFNLGDSEGRMPIFLPYSQLSQAKSSALLRHLDPDLIIADESQNLGNPGAARTKRFLRHFDDKPDCRFIALTGTITDQSIHEYAHLLRLAVRRLSFIPMPKDPHYNSWRSVIDVDGRPNKDDVRRMQPLCDLFKVPWPQREASNADLVAAQRKASRQAFNLRLASTYGVLMTTESSTDTALNISVVSPDFGPDLREIIKQVATEEVLPNGDDIVDGTELARHMGTLSIGFFNQWDWDAVDADSEWDKARKAWASEVRSYLKDFSREGCDSPALVERWVREESPRNNLSKAFWAWDALRDMDAPPTITTWVSNEVLIWARDWLYSQDGPAILWYYSRAVGERLSLMGMPVKTAKPKPDPRRMPQACLPMKVFHKGHNMQPYRNCLVLEQWSSGKMTEQLLGRNHRNGQEEACEWEILAHTDSQHRRLEKCVLRSEYIQDSTQQKQKLLLANWKDAPPAVQKILTRCS